jgi:hypothetical protein
MSPTVVDDGTAAIWRQRLIDIVKGELDVEDPDSWTVDQFNALPNHSLLVFFTRQRVQFAAFVTSAINDGPIGSLDWEGTAFGKHWHGR